MRKLNEIHLKYVDDLTMAEAINLPEQLVKVPASLRPQPDCFHARTGHSLPAQNSKVFKQLVKTQSQAEQNQMKLNFKKTKLITFNPCRTIDFMPEISIDGNELEVVDEIRLLGIILRSDMKWISNTKNMIQKANKRLWILRRLKSLGAGTDDLVEVYTKQIRCVLELAVPAWQGGISQAERTDLERVQKSASHIILGDLYTSYKCALKDLNLDSLESRRNKLTLKFALTSEKNQKFKSWFKTATKSVYTRSKLMKYFDVKANHNRFERSPLSFITKMLNLHHK